MARRATMEIAIKSQKQLLGLIDEYAPNSRHNYYGEAVFVRSITVSLERNMFVVEFEEGEPPRITIRLPLVIGNDGLPHQLQPCDPIQAATNTGTPKRIDEMTLDDYRRGVAAMWSQYSIPITP